MGLTKNGTKCYLKIPIIPFISFEYFVEMKKSRSSKSNHHVKNKTTNSLNYLSFME
jgi:hypothetical protein